jgi:acyl carrier protein
MVLTTDSVLAQIRERLPYVGPLKAEAPLDRLGLDSLDLVELLMTIDELFGVRLTIDDFKKARTVGDLAQSIAAGAAEGVFET